MDQNPTLSNPRPVNRKRKRRVDVACDFCRQRKLGCDNAKPKCENCFTRQKECVYTERAQKEKTPSPHVNNRRVDNDRQRRVAGNTRNTQTIRHKHQALHSEVLPITSRNLMGSSDMQNQTSEVSRMLTPNQSLTASPANSSPAEVLETRFHGPTSAIYYEEHLPEKKKTGPHKKEHALQKTLLLAEAARQRQLELVNLRSGKLDFDGLDPETGMELLSVFWNRQHSTGSIVYRPCFMRDMANQGPYFSKLLLNAIFFVASKHTSMGGSQQTPSDKCDGGMFFRRKVESILYNPGSRIIFESSITTIQALILMSDALFSWCDEGSLSWHFLGIATNMIIDLGIHSDISRRKTSLEDALQDVEVDRRVFWAAFIFDKIQSIYQGRPVRLRNTDCSVPITFMDEYEELESFSSIGYSRFPRPLHQPTYGVSTFEHLCRLSTIADDILGNIYAGKSVERDPEDLFRISKSLNADLVRWYQSLPAHLSISFDSCGHPSNPDTSAVLPHSLCVGLMFHALVILLNRPFVSEGHLRPVADLATNHASSLCETAATSIDEIVRLYKSRWCTKLPPYFLSYAVYVSATIHTRIVARGPQNSKARQCLQRCLETLSEHQIECNAARRAVNILRRLMKRLNVEVGATFIMPIPRVSGCQEPVSIESMEVSRFNPIMSEQTPNLPLSVRSASLNPASAVQNFTPVESFSQLPEPTNLDGLASTNHDNSPAQIDFDRPSVDWCGGENLNMYFGLDPLFGFDDFQMDKILDNLM